MTVPESNVGHTKASRMDVRFYEMLLTKTEGEKAKHTNAHKSAVVSSPCQQTG